MPARTGSGQSCRPTPAIDPFAKFLEFGRADAQKGTFVTLDQFVGKPLILPGSNETSRYSEDKSAIRRLELAGVLATHGSHPGLFCIGKDSMAAMISVASSFALDI